MKLRLGYTLRNLCGAHVLVAEGIKNVNLDKLYSFNETAAFIWETAEGKEFTIDYLAEALCGKYNVSLEQAKQDVQAMVENWKQHDLVEE